MNTPDTKTPQEELVGTNIPEFWGAVKQAVAYAHGYYHGAVTIFRKRANKREFMLERPGRAVDRKVWEPIGTYSPRGGFSE